MKEIAIAIIQHLLLTTKATIWYFALHRLSRPNLNPQQIRVVTRAHLQTRNSFKRLRHSVRPSARLILRDCRDFRKVTLPANVGGGHQKPSSFTVHIPVKNGNLLTKPGASAHKKSSNTVKTKKRALMILELPCLSLGFSLGYMLRHRR